MKPTIQIDDNRTLLSDTSNYTCCILVGRNYLSYALTNDDFTVIHLLKHYYFEDKVIGKNDFTDILSDPIFANVKNVKIAIDSLKSTLVPNALFADEHKESYFKLVHELTPEENIHTQTLLSNITSIYSLKKSTVSFLSSIYKNVRFYDASSCLLNTYAELLGNESIHTAFVCIKDDSVSISYYNIKELFLHQVHAANAITDITYHVANFCAVQEVDKEKLHIYLHGESVRVPIVYNEMIQYFPCIKYCSRLTTLNYPENLFSQPSHYFFNLFSLVKCA